MIVSLPAEAACTICRSMLLLIFEDSFFTVAVDCQLVYGKNESPLLTFCRATCWILSLLFGATYRAPFFVFPEVFLPPVAALAFKPFVACCAICSTSYRVLGCCLVKVPVDRCGT
jgi:hypothetical protein